MRGRLLSMAIGLAGAAALLAGAASAQDVLFEEDFEGINDLSESQMTGVSLASDKDWYLDEFGGTQFARVSGYQGDVDSDDWLVSPAIDLSSAGSPVLNFETICKFDGPDLTLWVSTDYAGDPAAATWTEHTGDAAWDDDKSDWGDWTPSGDVDLSAYAGESDVYIGFHYVSDDTGATNYELDDIVVLGDPLTDTDGDGVYDGDEPAGDVDGDGLENYEDTDSDNDNIPDGDEVHLGTEPWTQTSMKGLFWEHYEDDNGLGKTSGVSLASDKDWGRDSFGGTSFAKCSGYEGDQPSDDWLISEAIDLTDMGALVLNFETISRFAGPDCQLLVSTDYDPQTADPAAAAWDNLTDQATWDENKDEWGDWVASGDVGLDAYMGQTIFVAFQYTSTNDEASTYEVDDIVVYGEPDNDYDDDGLTNDEEDALGTDPTAADSDGDGLTDYEEVGGDATYDEGLDTDPMNADSDGDGHSDGAEVDAGTDPLDENDAPSSAPAMDVWALLLLAGLLAVAFLALQRRPARTPARR